MAKNKSDKSNSWRRTIIEYAVIIGVAVFLYTTGYYVEVVGRLQQLVLWTGIFQPDIEQPAQQQPVDLNIPLVSLNGERTNLAEHRGKVLFINFWATWCPPCVAEMPDIQALYQSYKNNPNIVFVMISLDKDKEKARKFIHKKGFTFPVYMPTYGIPKSLQSQVVPTTFVINKKGQVATKRQGMAKYDTHRFKTFLDSLSDGS